MCSVQSLVDAAGRRRSPATMPGFRAGVAPRNKGQRYPADPPTVDEIVAVMRQAGHDRHGHRGDRPDRGALARRATCPRALSLAETDLDQRRGSILVRHGKNDRRREVGMDAWAWSAIEPWLADRVGLPIGPLFCVIDGPTRGRAWSDGAARVELHHLALKAGAATADPAPARPLAPLNDRHLPARIPSEEIISAVHAPRADPLVHELDGVRVAQLVRREPAPGR